MAIDYRRAVDGVGASTTGTEGLPGSPGIEVIVNAVRQSTGATGAAAISYDGRGGGRVVAATDAMTWLLGWPVAGEFVETVGAGRPWSGRVDSLAPEVAAQLAGRGLVAIAGYPIRVEDEPVGGVHLFFGAGDGSAWDQCGPALRLAAVLAGSVCPGGDGARRPHPAVVVPEQRSPVDQDDRTLFLAMAGHELRTPVTAIKGYAGMLAERWDVLDESDRREAAKVIQSRAGELARLVDRMLGASVGDSAAGWLVRTVPFDLVEALGRAVHELNADLRPRVRLDLPERMPLGRGDPTLLASIVGELVTNAVRYSGVVEYSGTAEAMVEIEAGADARTVFVRVSDRGIGIDPSHVQAAFDRFWRARRSETPGGGVGLGLYLVRRLVERQNGWVSLRPRDGGGTVAEVRLPRADGLLRPRVPGEA
jgi:two-component system phosphate regulon sensor histidine kinase PhoR